MSERPASRVDIGRISKAHGLNGEVVVTGGHLTPDEFAAVSVMFARAKDGALEPLTVAAARPFLHNLLVRFQGVTDKDRADLLRGKVLEADPARLPKTEDGTVYLFQLLGLAVRTVEGQALGRVHDVWATGASPVLVVRAPAEGAEAEGGDAGPGGAKGRERLIPMSPDVLIGVDLEARLIEVRLLPGMEDL